MFKNQCPVCASRELKVFFKISDIPINCNILWADSDSAKNCPKGDIQLAFCPICGFITNLKFKPEYQEYNQLYENSLFFSPRFQDFAKSLAMSLIERYNLYNKNIIEIGCGKGDFLYLLCELGNNRGVGFDPTYSRAREKHNEAKYRVKFIQDLYSERYMSYPADLIFSWHVLEHIDDPKRFLKMLRITIGDRKGTRVFFCVPNASDNLCKLFIWDIIYEHVSYFTPHSLTYLFSSCGFQVCDLTVMQEGQSLCIDVIPDNQKMLDPTQVGSKNSEIEIDEMAECTASFAVRYQEKVKSCRKRLRPMLDRGRRVVIWGAGSRGVTFLNILKDVKIEYAVDINPRKQWNYIPGTGQRIIPPESLKEYQPDIIIVMNPIYMNEIKEITNTLGLKSKFISI